MSERLFRLFNKPPEYQYDIWIDEQLKIQITIPI